MSDEQWDFAKLVGAIIPAIGSPVTGQYLDQVCQKVGISAIIDAANKPEVIPQIIAVLRADKVIK